MKQALAEVAELAQAGRSAEALELLEKLGERGEPMALITLADFYWTGTLLPQAPAKGRDLYRRAGEHGHPRGRFTFTNLLASGICGPRDWQAAVARLRNETFDVDRARILQLLEDMSLTEDGSPVALPEPQQLSTFPDVTLFPGLFTPKECNHLLSVAELAYEPSNIQDENGRDVRHSLRTSDGAALHWLIEDPAIHAMGRRIAVATNTNYDQAEPFLILRYKIGQQYFRHLDALPGLDNQRTTTALIYLNTDYEGGETEFWRAGLKIRGRRGDVLVFRNLLPNGSIDQMSEHAGLPVLKGTKYVASRWIRTRRQVP